MTNWEIFINELLDRADLVGLISKYVQLTKKGSSYWGCCPFHHEKTPSFCVNESKKMFHCFGCQTGGNAITFLAKIESIGNMDAIKMLADSLNMRLPESEFKQQTDWEAQKRKKERLCALLKDCAVHYHDNLSLPQARAANEYLTKRKISPGMIKRFGLGYSLGYDEAVEHLKNKGYTYDEMREAGLAGQKADKFYDIFAKRLMIPIVDQFNNVTAFGGRILEAGEFAKYRNSSTTPVFDKSKTLFALNLVKKKKQKEGINRIIIAEGYMDVIALHEAGFDMAVASMGTALTGEQAKLIKNFTDNVYISYDGDSAGQKATLRGLEILKESGLNVRVIVLDEGLDPDDIIKRYGAGRYQQLMDSALPLTAYKVESQKKLFNLADPDGRSGFAMAAVNIIKQLDNPVEIEEYLTTVHKATGYSMQVLYRQADLQLGNSAVEPKSEGTATATPPIQAVPANQDGITKAKEYILSCLIAKKPFVDVGEDIYSLLDDGAYERIYGILMEFIREENYHAGLLYSHIEEADLPLLNELISYQEQEGDGANKYYDCINLCKRNKIDKAIARIREEYRVSPDKNLLNELKILQDQLNELKRK